MVQVVTTKDFLGAFRKYAADVINYNEPVIVARPQQKML